MRALTPRAIDADDVTWNRSYGMTYPDRFPAHFVARFDDPLADLRITDDGLALLDEPDDDESPQLRMVSCDHPEEDQVTIDDLADRDELILFCARCEQESPAGGWAA